MNDFSYSTRPHSPHTKTHTVLSPMLYTVGAIRIDF